MKSIKMSVGIANLMLLITAFVWGSGFVVTEIALGSSLTPAQVICGRMFVASVILDIAFWKKLKAFSKADIKAGCIIGLSLFLGSILQTHGLKFTTSSISAFVTSIYVVMIPFIKFAFFKDRPDVYSNIAALLTVIGVGFISLNGFEISFGIPLTLVCAVFFALQVIFTDIYAKELDPIKLTVVTINLNFLLGLIMSAADVVSTGVYPNITSEVAANMLYLGSVCTFLAATFQNVAQKYTFAVQAAIIMSLESVFGALLSVVILGEKLSARLVIGCAVVFIAIIISETKLKFLKRGVL